MIENRTKRSRSIQVLEFPPLESKLVKFMEAIPLSDSNYKKHLSLMEDQIKYLKEISEALLSKRDKESDILQKARVSSQKKLKTTNRLLLFARSKYHRIFAKYHQCIYDHYNSCVISINSILSFLNKSLDICAPVKFEFDGFKETLKFPDLPLIQKMEMKIKSLTSYVNNLSMHPCQNTINTEVLNHAMDEASKKVNEVLNYAPPNSFDELFYSFAQQTGLIKKFHQLISKMPSFPSSPPKSKPPLLKPPPIPRSQSPVTIPAELSSDSSSLNDSECFDKALLSKIDLASIAPPISFQEEIQDPFDNLSSFNFKDFNSFVQFFFVALDSNPIVDKKRFTVMRCASIRILFDLYFIQNYSVLFGALCSKKFIENCHRVREMTPKALNINPTIIGNHNMDIPMVKIIESNHDLMDSIEMMFTSQFYCNPLDMAEQFHKGIKAIERGIRTISNQPQCFLDLSFDDLFSIVLPIYSSKPCASPPALHRFLSLFQDLKLSTSLEYSNVSLKALISFLSN